MAFLRKYVCLLMLVLPLFCFAANIITGAEQTSMYLPVLKGKKIALVVNQTSKIGNTHLVDSLLKMGINIQVIFAPEHGFRGNVSAGTTVSNGKDDKTGIRIISLYGSHKKPTHDELKDIQLVVFDIQDVGVRYYTYISTMHYVMETCAELNVPFMVLDRPNPNGHFIDGPILDTAYRSFVGMHQIPLVHGCTVGELAGMINGEGWLNKKMKCDLTVITCKNYSHNTEYVLPVRPSPNLQTQSAIYLYASLGLFEGTTISMGQGTDKPYQCFGSPANDWGNFNFTPVSIKGVAEKPKSLGIPCTGFDLTDYGYKKARSEAEINLNWLVMSYRLSKNKPQFFNDFFDKLAGTAQLKKQIIEGKSVLEIKQSWQKGLDNYRVMQRPYLLYEWR
ncbi:MAG: exo-beta-N-acetylmuramidase NamZ domain-containing protein [Chitinophagaceae bacterium]